MGKQWVLEGLEEKDLKAIEEILKIVVKDLDEKKKAELNPKYKPKVLDIEIQNKMKEISDKLGLNIQ